MEGFEVARDAPVDEVLHLDQVVPLRHQVLRLPDGDAPLAVERLVRRSGPSRPPVILVHGFAQNRYTWRLSRRSFAGYLAHAGYDVLNLELRGHGRSRELGSGSARGFEEYVDDVERVARRAGGRPFAIGHSLGGAVVVGAATRTPMSGLVSVAGLHTFASRNRTLRALARVSLAGRRAVLPFRASTRVAGRLLGRLFAVSDLMGFGLPLAGWAPGSVEEDLLRERLERGFDWTSLEVWLEMSRWAQGARLPWADALQRLDVPLLAIAGDADPLVPPDDVRESVAQTPGADRQVIVFEPWEHGGHWGHIDLVLGRRAPDEVWPRVRAWLDERC